jgi:hypothetical protein
MERRRLRKGANSSVSRVLACDALTTEWLRNLRSVRKDDVVSIPYCEDDCVMGKGVHTLTSLPTSPLVSTPLSSWTEGSPHVNYNCSFCGVTIKKDEKYNVHFNHILTTPFVVACGMCDEKIR